MATKYVDLSQVASGTGVIGDPFNFADLISDANAAAVANSYLMKGSFTDTGDYDITCTADQSIKHRFVAWDATLYGPWRLKVNTLNIRPSLCQGGILFTDSVLYMGKSAAPIAQGMDYEFATCYINVANVQVWDVGWSQIFKGCNIVTGTNYAAYSTSTGPDFYDCLLSITTGLASISGPPVLSIINVNNCAISTDRATFVGSYSGSMGTETGTEYSWVAPSWPAWNAINTAFALATLVGAALTPPRPGTSPYTGYATDLFGVARTDIGAYYGTSPIPTGTRYIAEATAHGWTKNNIYTYNGSTWDETVAVEGLTSYDKTSNTTWQFDGTNWVLVISDEKGQINTITSKATPSGSDVLLIEDSADTFKKKKIAISSLQAPYLERVFYPCHVITRDAYPPVIEDVSFANNIGFTYPMMRLSGSAVREYFVALPMPINWDMGTVDMDIYFASLESPVDPAHQDIVIGAKIWADSLGNPINLDLGTFYSSTVAVTSQYNLCVASVTGIVPIVPSGNPLTYPGILWLKWFRAYGEALDTFDGKDVWCPYVSFRWRTV